MLIERYRYRRGNLAILSQRRRDLHSADAGLFIAGEVEAFDLARFCVGQCKDNVRFIDGNLLIFVKRSHGQLSFIAVNSVNIALCEVQLIRNDNVQRLLSNNFAVKHQIYFDVAIALCSEQSILRDLAPAFIRYSPGSAFRHFNGITGCADRNRRNLHAGANRHIIALGFQNSMIKCSGAGRSGIHQKGCRYRASSAVRGAVYNRKHIVAFLSGNKGRRSTAVKVNCMYAAGLKHDLRDFLHASAGREGLLSAVENHEYNLAAAGNTYGRTRCAAIIVIAGCSNRNLAILDKHSSESADGFFDLRCITAPFSRCTDNRLAGFQNRKESIGSDRLIDLAVHDQKSARVAVAHVIAAGIDRSNCIEVGNIVFAFFVSVQCLRIVRLIQYTRHRPIFGISAYIVGDYVNVFPADIGSRSIVYNLLTVNSRRVIDLLCNTGRQCAGFGREYSVIAAFNHIHKVAGESAQIICKCVTTGLSHIGKVVCVEFSRAFEGRDYLVAGVCIEHSIADIASEAYAAQTVLKEERRAELIVQRLREICLHERSHIAGIIVGRIQRLHHIERVKIAVHIGLREQIAVVEALAQIVCLNICNHLFKRILIKIYAVSVNRAQKVDKVSGPAADVRMIYAALIVIGNVHRAEHMAEVHLIAVGNIEVLNILKTADLEHLFIRDGAVDHVFHFSDKLGKSGVFIAGHDAPGAGVVAVNTGTDILDNEHDGILAGILLHVFKRKLLKKRQVHHKLIIRFDHRRGQHFDLFIAVLVSAHFAQLILVPANLGIGCLLGLNSCKRVLKGNTFGSAAGKAGLGISAGYACPVVAVCLAFRRSAAIDTGLGQGAGSIRKYVILLLGKRQSASVQASGNVILTGRDIHIVSERVDEFLCFDRYFADRAIRTLRIAFFCTRGRLGGLHNFSVAQRRNNDFLAVNAALFS